MQPYLFVAVSKQNEKEIGVICSRLGYVVSSCQDISANAPTAFLLPPQEIEAAWRTIQENYPSPMLLVIDDGKEGAMVALRPFAYGYLDASRMLLSDVESWISALVQKPSVSFSVRFESFGYKHGIPGDADLVLDCRNVPNPYWVEELRPLTGLDSSIVSFLDQKEEVQLEFESFERLLSWYLDKSEKQRKREVVIAFGCTGGQHRSVYFTERLYSRFQNVYPCRKLHRELSWKKKGGAQ